MLRGYGAKEPAIGGPQTIRTLDAVHLFGKRSRMKAIRRSAQQEKGKAKGVNVSAGRDGGEIISRLTFMG